MNIHNITVIGVGLIGASFAKGIKDLNIKCHITGVDSDESSLQKAIELNVLDDYSMDIQKAVENADLILVSVPLGAMESIFTAIEPHIKQNTIITDVGSSKASVIQSAEKVFGRLPNGFVPGHPIAGKEKSGVSAAASDLFESHKVILTPTNMTSKKALDTVKALWESLGACVIEMSPEYHDDVFAATSHLPHLLAYGLVNLLNEHEELGNVFQYTAGGFRDFTRIASSDATMWKDICLNNQTAIVKWLKNYQQEIDLLIQLIESRESDQLYQLFKEAKTARDTHIVKKTD